MTFFNKKALKKPCYWRCCRLPTEVVLFHILPRLPAKSVVRFRSVSKEWNSFINTQIFVDMHLHHVTNDNHQNRQKLIVLPTIDKPRKFSTIDLEPSNDHGLSPSRCLPFTVEKMTFLTSIHGLVLVGLKDNWYDYHYYAYLILWNPLTGDFKTLSPEVKSHHECYEIKGIRAFGLYYSSSEDGYRILCVTKSCNVYIYSLKSDSWRKVESIENSRLISDWNLNHRTPSVLLNENLYFLKKFNSKSCIMKFDSKTEYFKEIITPTIENQNVECLRFAVQGDCIHLCIKYDDIWIENSRKGCIELWTMNGDGDWAEVVTDCPITQLPLFMHPEHLISNGNWLMSRDKELWSDDHGGNYLYQVEPEKHINDNARLLNNFCSNIPGEGKYIETFVSPNRCSCCKT